MTSTNCAQCGHDRAKHYNARPKRKSRIGLRTPCHRLGAHDMRCECKCFIEPAGFTEVHEGSDRIEAVDGVRYTFEEWLAVTGLTLDTCDPSRMQLAWRAGEDPDLYAVAAR